MFIVLKLHRESLREMLQKGRVSHSVKIKVLEMLKPIVCDQYDHGDIKELGFSFYRKSAFIINVRFEKPKL